MSSAKQGEPPYGWVIVAAGALMTCVAFGAVFALAVFLQPMADATGWSRAGISGAMTLVFLAMGAGGFFWGTLSDRFGARPVVLAASVLLALGLALASRAGSLLEFQLAYGLLVGFAGGGFFPPFIAVAFVFGLAYGGVMPLYAVLARGYFGPAIMGGVIGAASLISSLGMALGPLAGGWTFDAFGTYTWLYVGSFAVGLGAVAIALAFPPLPREPGSMIRPVRAREAA